MKQGILAGLASVGFLILVIAPGAADAQPAPPPAALPFTWTGIYLGIDTGPAFGTAQPMALFTNSFSAFNFSANGWLGGVTAGAQLQSHHVVLGVEGDINWTNISGSGTGTIAFNGASIGTATLSSKVSSLSTARTRIGYASANWLWYVTGGFAVTDEKSTLTGPIGFACGTGAVNSPPCSSSAALHVGITGGGGFEYGITRSVSAKFEYLWVGAGALNTLKENILRAGLSWRFGM
jgi:outer membrane immunogenic protein